MKVATNVKLWYDLMPSIISVIFILTVLLCALRDSCMKTMVTPTGHP